MAQAKTGRSQAPDIAAQVTFAMRVMGVSPIPRNYELYYEAYLGSNPKLTQELAALGSKATQEELDLIGARHFGHIHYPAGVERVHAHLAKHLNELVAMMKQEQFALENYTKLLDETSAKINNKGQAGVEILRQAVAILSSATSETISEGRERAENVSQKSVEMEAIRQELDEYKRIANTDSLTRLANRRAFDERLAAVYNSEQLRSFTSLLIADIDHFKKINDSFGHPIGDKILATVGNVIRSTLRRDTFVARTGGEEFAVILTDASPDESFQVAERIRSALAATPFKNSKTGANYGPITLSIGLCQASAAEDSVDLYNKADIALYCAKNTGRNRTTIFEDGMKKDGRRGWLIYRK
ncbi:diguanylate cyclase [Xaviernesmea oryzae]|uniref:diguanylate cyclase n=1 Tax=Xaviernesmea oryzae TaxID=464029 RepID=A0A1Q9B0D0_9HYPH|nr:GGDEF domain-containing protein [Xaviernesmea oryzae]OLP61430.1 diguanylate cyclase [Xaviernesmea oryzae]SEL69516.1 diguanylate cyclase [Xaviernesmea oryzae]